VVVDVGGLESEGNNEVGLSRIESDDTRINCLHKVTVGKVDLLVGRDQGKTLEDV
jgi:hypothetical protein